ncbi:MAG: Gx transporter family protein [Candidatus Atribacteria bacterium]|nr:Gx transporter family protein [Candidatus Atribacteria bacterium]
MTRYPINGIKKVVYLAALIAIGVVLNLVEPIQIFPLLPGAKLGLANISSLLAILLFGGANGVLVASIRTVASIVIRGSLNWISFGTSFFGGVSAALVMAFFYRFFGKKLSIEGLSALGGITNNVVQILFVYLVTKNTLFLYYALFLIPIGGVAGFIIGILAHIIYNRLADT